jgi:glycosyltransferase involved in cell wall biosynthesis
MSQTTDLAARASSISVIVPTYNRARLLAKTLASIERQSLPSEAIDVVVVDDGSSDDTKAVAESFQQTLSLKYVHQRDLGFRVARARNLGIRVAEGDLCAFIDSGVVLDSGCLAAHLDAHRCSGRARAIIGYVLAFSQSADGQLELAALIDRCGEVAAFRELLCLPEHADLREPVYRECADDLSQLPAPWVLFWTCNVSVQRAALLAVGGFDERYQSWGCEDVDLGCALFRAGVDFALCREARSLHYPHQKSREENVRSSAGNRQYLHSKYGVRATELLLTKRCMEINRIMSREAASDEAEQRNDEHRFTSAGDAAATWQHAATSTAIRTRW